MQIDINECSLHSCFHRQHFRVRRAPVGLCDHIFRPPLHTYRFARRAASQFRCIVRGMAQGAGTQVTQTEGSVSSWYPPNNSLTEVRKTPDCRRTSASARLNQSSLLSDTAVGPAEFVPFA